MRDWHHSSQERLRHIPQTQHDTGSASGRRTSQEVEIRAYWSLVIPPVTHRGYVCEQRARGVEVSLS